MWFYTQTHTITPMHHVSHVKEERQILTIFKFSLWGVTYVILNCLISFLLRLIHVVWEGILSSGHSFLHVMIYHFKTPYKCGERNECLIPEKKWWDFVHLWEHMTASTNRLDCKGLYFMLNEITQGMFSFNCNVALDQWRETWLWVNMEWSRVNRSMHTFVWAEISKNVTLQLCAESACVLSGCYGWCMGHLAHECQ